MTIGSATIAVTAISTAVVRPVLAPVIASCVRGTVQTALAKILWKSAAGYFAEMASRLVYAYWTQVYAATVFMSLTALYLAILAGFQMRDILSSGFKANAKPFDALTVDHSIAFVSFC